MDVTLPLRWIRGRHSSILLTGGVAIVYIGAYLPLYAALGNSTGILSTLPVLVAAWYFGPRVGALCGLLTFPVNALLTTQLVGQEWDAWARTGGILGSSVEIFVGFVVGYVSNLHRRSSSLLVQRADLEQALRTGEELFRGVFSHAPIGIVVTDPGLRIARANHAFCAMFGRAEEELIGKTVSDITNLDDVSAHLATAWEQLRTRTGPLRMEKRYIRRDGSVFPAVVTATIVRDQNREIRFGVGLVEDVTIRRQMEEQIRHAERLESLGTFAAGIAHNFNNALTIVGGHAELAAMQLEPGHPAQGGLTHIRRVADASEAIVQELLVFSRQDVGRPSRCDLNTIVQSTTTLLVPLLGDYIRLDTQLDRSIDPIWADPLQLEQIITNLVFNARDAMAAGGVVRVETGQHEFDEAAAAAHPVATAGRYTRLTVVDTGKGMDPETRRRVFDPFFTTKEQGKGVGLGLTMVHGAVRKSGGFLSIESEPAVGSRFVLHWPAIDSNVENGQKRRTASTPVRHLARQ